MEWQSRCGRVGYGAVGFGTVWQSRLVLVWLGEDVEVWHGSRGKEGSGLAVLGAAWQSWWGGAVLG